MYALLLAAVLFCITGVVSTMAQAPKSRGKYTTEFTQPKTAHVQNFVDEGKRRRLRGKLICCDEGIPQGAIISIYAIEAGREKFIYSYLVGSTGRFEFKGLRDGEYLLKTGTVEGYFNSLYVKVFLASKDPKSSKEDLTIPMEVGT